MWYQALVIPVMMITIYCHTPKNNSDVIVTYTGHSEAHSAPRPVLEPKPSVPETTNSPTSIPELTHYDTTPYLEEEKTDSVVFIPNQNPVYRRDDGYMVSNDKKGESNVFTEGQNIQDIMNPKNIRMETEPPTNDILFISGKNKEREHRKETPKEQKTAKADTRRSGRQKERSAILNCEKLNCNNTLKSVCGGKIEHKKWRYRLFLNECFFRKVNCNFKHEENRFKMVPLEKCKLIAAHYSERRSWYKPSMSNLQTEQKPESMKNLRRSFSSRRSTNLDSDGKTCSHLCPTTCPEEYAPQCAVSDKGVKKVFINHCKLDFNSCLYDSAWYRRPLSECVGKKADLAQNSAFIGWMQRVGIVDNKGRLSSQ